MLFKCQGFHSKSLFINISPCNIVYSCRKVTQVHHAVLSKAHYSEVFAAAPVEMNVCVMRA